MMRFGMCSRSVAATMVAYTLVACGDSLVMEDDRGPSSGETRAEDGGDMGSIPRVEVVPVDPCLAPPAPTIDVIFPGATAAINDEAITIRGRASVACGDDITSVRASIGGAEIELPITVGSDVAWQTTMVLPDDAPRSIVLHAATSADPEAETTVEVIREVARAPRFADMRGVLLLADQQTAYVADRGRDLIMAIDLVTDSRAVLSGAGVGDGPAFDRMEGDIAFDRARNRLVVTDRGLDAIVG
ncbi:MAG: hypothetical protein AAGA56_31230, partial [Myxococcota bacterium]